MVPCSIRNLTIRSIAGIVKNVLAVTSLDATRNTHGVKWSEEKKVSRSNYSGGPASLKH